MRISTYCVCASLALGATPTFAQNADIAIVLGDVVAIEQTSEECPGVYPDVRLMEQTENQVWAFAVSTYGETQAMVELNSPQMQSAISRAAEAAKSAFVSGAGDAYDVCDYVKTDAVRGFSLIPEDQQEMSMEENVPSQVQPADPEVNLTPLVPAY